jgi:hypothetical protein
MEAGLRKEGFNSMVPTALPCPLFCNNNLIKKKKQRVKN